LIQESLESLHRGGIIEAAVSVNGETSLFGEHSDLDSMGFVTFVSDIEERLSRKADKELFIILSDLEEMYPASAKLTVSMFTNYLTTLLSS
jgi:acyl carrier protein